MTNKDMVNLCCLKVFLVGPPGVGKTTTLNRLLRAITNILISGDKNQSTLLVNCIQALVCIADNTSEWLHSKDISDETKLLLRYFCGRKIEASTGEVAVTKTSSTHLSSVDVDEKPASPLRPIESEDRLKTLNITTSEVDKEMSQHISSQMEQQETAYRQNRFLHIRTQLRQLVTSDDYFKITNHSGSTLLNINDVGGQPCFLEMLPALSTGPALYLVFLDLSKELDKPYKIPFSRDDTIITPYSAMHTVEATIWQILSAIVSVHSVSHEAAAFAHSATVSEKFKHFLKVSPVAALIGTHKDKLDHPEEKIKQTDEALKKITQNFKKILVSPFNSPNASFFSVDNYAGTEETDIGPIREFVSAIFSTHFKEASVPICPKWLLLGALLRREYKIVVIDDCLEIGRMLEMDNEEIMVCLWYLNCIGTVMHYTRIADDEDDWFKNHVICSPQVIFDSISQLILPSLRILHSEGPATDHERDELIRKGQFTIESIDKYSSIVNVTENLKKDELIPAKQLVKLLKHVNLLSSITHREAGCSQRITYLMPAVLECAPLDKLSTPPPPDENNPEPLYVTFSCGYVPTGTFCGLVTRLVSLGPHGILGLEWDLVEDGVKRNCVSFYIDYVNQVMLICHDEFYEIRVICNDPKSLHELCAYILSAIFYTLKSLYENLVPQISFQCLCPKHAPAKDIRNLCTLVETNTSVRFLCGKTPVTVKSTQQCWMGKVSNSNFVFPSFYNSKCVPLLITVCDSW